MTQENESRPDFEQAMSAIGLASSLLENNKDVYMSLIQTERRMHSTMPITDPTLYRQAINSENFKNNVVLCRAALTFIAEVMEIKAMALEKKVMEDEVSEAESKTGEADGKG